MSKTHQPVTEFIKQSEDFHQHIKSIYTPLDPTCPQIRLMHICASSSEDERIDVTLSVVGLKDNDDKPQYDALSYTWDSLSPTKTIFLCGFPYQVTVNQYSALRRLRLLDESRTMWMDVICINQADVVERGQQVSIMDQIYAGAVQTRIWLGEPQSSWWEITDYDWDNHIADLDSKPELVAFMKRCANTRALGIKEDFATIVQDPSDGFLQGALHFFRLLTNRTHFRDMPYCYVSDTGKLMHYRPFYHVLEMVLSLLKRPWWTRVWVLQEAVLSKTPPVVHVGSQQISVRLFTEARQGWNHCIDTWEHDDRFLNHVYNIPAFINGMSRLMTYGNALDTLRHKFGNLALPIGLELVNKRSAGDIRDFVYGIMGVVSGDERIPIDYSLTAGETFSLAAWHVYADLVGGFEMLKEAVGPNSDGMPSWAVNWANRHDLHFIDSNIFEVREETDADRTSCFLSMGTLKLTANKIDKVTMVLQMAGDPDVRESDRALEIIDTWVRRLHSIGMLPDPNLNSGNSSHTSSSNSNSVAYFLTTIFREMVKNEQGQTKRFSSSVNDDDGTEWRDILEWIQQLTLTPSPPAMAASETRNDEGPNIQTPSHRVASTFESSVTQSVLCVTEQGRLCMAIDSVRPDDLLYHIRGCSVPLALRSAPLCMLKWIDEDDGDDGPVREKWIAPFRVVGPCYMKGAMGLDGSDRVMERDIYLV